MSGMVFTSKAQEDRRRKFLYFVNFHGKATAGQKILLIDVGRLEERTRKGAAKVTDRVFVIE